MNTRHVWIEIILLGTAIAIALALLFATLGAAAWVAVGQTAQVGPATNVTQSFEGMSTCVRVCVHGGAAFALIDGESVYRLEGDAGALKKLAGQRARITGTRTGNIINVASVASES